MYFNSVDKVDPEIGAAIRAEMARQENKLELIASENFTSASVLEACGSALSNKYAEGYPGKRYYGGCEEVDVVENLAIERLKNLFHAEHVNVQPHSGSNANIAVYFALLEYGDTVLGLDLSNGGHLSHGSPVNMSGKNYNFIPYKVNPITERIDFDELRKLAHEHKPKMIVAGCSAYPRVIESDKFREIADEVGAYLVVDMAHFAGLVAAGLHPNPVEHADVVTTTTHKTLRGPRGGAILCKEQFAKQIDKAIFPGIQGGPPDAYYRRQSSVLQGSWDRSLQDLSKAGACQCSKAFGGIAKTRFHHCVWRYGYAYCAAQPYQQEHYGKGSRTTFG